VAVIAHEDCTVTNLHYTLLTNGAIQFAARRQLLEVFHHICKRRRWLPDQTRQFQISMDAMQGTRLSPFAKAALLARTTLNPSDESGGFTKSLKSLWDAFNVFYFGL